MARMNNPDHMKQIYLTAKRVYQGELGCEEAAQLLLNNTPASKSSLIMYFNIYKAMKKGACYKMGTSADFTICIGDVTFETEGTVKEVKDQEKWFTANVLPGVLKVMAKVSDNSPDKTTQRPKKNKKQGKATSKEKPSVGKALHTNHPEIEKLKQRMDFKARMIPLMYLASIDKMQSDFSIKEIQDLILDALGERSNIKQIEDVFNRRADWFEKTQANPRRYKLLEIGYDYAKNILFY